MSNETNIAILYRDFEDALTDVLIENEYGPARRSRLFDARTHFRSHPDITASEYMKAVDRAFERYSLLKRSRPAAE